MGPLHIVEGHPGGDAGSGFAAIGVGFEVHLLVLERAPQPLGEDVVEPAATPVHRDADIGSLEPACEGRTGELAAIDGLLTIDPIRGADAARRPRRGRC